MVKKTGEGGKPVGEYNLLVEPGGAVKVLTPDEKKQRLKVLK